MAKSPHPVDVHVGSRVRLRRMMINMSQETLGKHLDLTFQPVQKYEKGSNRIGASRLYTISQILDVPISFFFEDMPDHLQHVDRNKNETGLDNNDITTLMDFVASREGLELNRSFVEIQKTDTRRACVDLLKSIAASSK